MTAADLELMLIPRYRTVARGRTPDGTVMAIALYDGPSESDANAATGGEIPWPDDWESLAYTVSTTQPDALTLDVAADLAEELGLDDRATELRWLAVLGRGDGPSLVAAVPPSDRARVARMPGRLEITWQRDPCADGRGTTRAAREERYRAVPAGPRVAWFRLRPDGVHADICSPPACAPAVLAALRQATAR